MNRSFALFLVLFLSVAPLYAPPLQQRYERVLIGPAGSRQTMKPVVRGAQYAAASMATQATMAAERILRAGGNAFDAIVAGQAVLGFVLEQSNGIGGDAVLLVYDAKTQK